MSEQVQDVKRNAGPGHFVRRGIPFAVLLVVAIVAYIYWQRADHSPQPAAGTPAPGPVPVNVLTVQKETVPIAMRFLGQTEGSQVVEIPARVAGYLQERTFNEGGQVEKGQKLFQIDPRPFEVEVAQAKARLASAEATLERASQQLRRIQALSARRVAAEEEVEDW